MSEKSEREWPTELVERLADAGTEAMVSLYGGTDQYDFTRAVLDALAADPEALKALLREPVGLMKAETREKLRDHLSRVEEATADGRFGLHTKEEVIVVDLTRSVRGLLEEIEP